MACRKFFAVTQLSVRIELSFILCEFVINSRALRQNRTIKLQVISALVFIRDVKTVYFSERVAGLPKPVFYRLLKGLL